MPRIILNRPDQPYELRWMRGRSEALISSLERPASFADLRNRRRNFYAMCAIVWASLVERGHRFLAPEDLAEYLETPAQQATALAAITEMIDEAYPPDEAQKKSSPTASSSEQSSAPPP